MSSLSGFGAQPQKERIVVYFEGHRTLLFALIMLSFEFVEQCFMSHNLPSQ